MSQPAFSHETLDAAVDWLVKLSSGAVSDELNAQFQLWLDADIHHAMAWQQLTQSMSGFEQVQHLAGRQEEHVHAVRQVLSGKPLADRRHFLKSGAAVVALGLGTAYLANRVTPLSYIMSDHVTSTGERQEIALADGTRVKLNARSALDVDFSEKQRVLTLHQGACIVDVAPDALRPLLLRTVHGLVRAGGGCRMLAGISGGQTYAMVQQQSLVVAPLHQPEAVLSSSEAVAAWFDQHALMLKPANVNASMAWEHGMLDVRDQRLEEVVESLRAYHAGWIRLAPRAAGLRVFGMFQLDDIGQVMHALQSILPISIRRYGSLVTMIDLV